MSEEDKSRLTDALKVVEELAPKFYSILKKGCYEISCKKNTDHKQIESAVKIYLHAKDVHLTPRVIQLLVMFVKYDTTTKSRKKISKEIKMSAVAINQNVMALKKEGLVVYPYEDTKKSFVHNDLLKLKGYIMDRGKTDLLITYGT